MHHTTTLVVDFDDTLALTYNRDWENAVANWPLIEKLNGLYDEGWTIHIVTARGQLSCAGDCVAADEKYRKQIEGWLVDHGVKYTDLSFQKKLAAYYIDDKGMTPEVFLNTFRRVKLTGGMSGASVFLEGDHVIKTATNTLAAIEWYTFAAEHYNVPKIISVIGDTIKMERLYEYQGHSTESFNRVLEVCKSFRNFRPLHPGLLPHMYVKRCMHRIEEPLKNEIDLEFLNDILSYAVALTHVTFGHGDYSISNIMTDSGGKAVYLIDPINDPTLLSSWVIDLAKLYMSIGLTYGECNSLRTRIEEFAMKADINVDCIRAHEIGHLCRVYPYAKDGYDKEQILKTIKDRINVLRQKVNLS